MKSVIVPLFLAVVSLLPLPLLPLPLLPSAEAQTAAPTPIPPPAPPFVSEPPRFCSWTIKVVSKPPSPTPAPATNRPTASIQNPTNSPASEPAPLKPAPPVIQASNTVTGDLKRIDSVTADGKTQVVWFTKNLQIMQAENDPSQIVLSQSGGSAPPPDGSLGPTVIGPGFPGFWWLNLSCYKDVVKVNSRPCYHFHVIPPPPPPEKTLQMTLKELQEVDRLRSKMTQEKEAWIDVETKLPVALAGGGLIYSYTFLQTPTAMLTLPQAMKTAVEEQNARLQRLQQLERLQGGR